jgi:NAD(P)H-nitrite reductase large subunit
MTNIKNFDYIITGAGIAGTNAAKTLREADLKATILLINNEDRIPYKRTQINKNIAAGFSANQFSLYQPEWFAENRITLINATVDLIDIDSKTIKTSTACFGYGKLLIATGSTPRGTGNQMWDKHIIHIRTAAQAEHIISQLAHKQHFLIAGAGSEGVETAVQLAMAGKQVTVIDRNKYPLHNYVTQEIGNIVAKTLTENNINLIFNQQIKEIKSHNGYEIITNDHQLKADAIICCLGVTPNTGLAIKSGIKTSLGIDVDETMLTSADSVYAAGDVACPDGSHPAGLWHAAEYQGKVAALNMAGIHTPFTNPTYRFKTELFGQYVFSAGFHNFDAGHKIEEIRRDKSIRLIASKDGVLKGIVSLNEKELAKTFQKALLEKWDIDLFNKNILMNEKI